MSSDDITQNPDPVRTAPEQITAITTGIQALGFERYLEAPLDPGHALGFYLPGHAVVLTFHLTQEPGAWEATFAFQLAPPLDFESLREELKVAATVAYNGAGAHSDTYTMTVFYSVWQRPEHPSARPLGQWCEALRGIVEYILDLPGLAQKFDILDLTKALPAGTPAAQTRITRQLAEAQPLRQVTSHLVYGDDPDARDDNPWSALRVIF